MGQLHSQEDLPNDLLHLTSIPSSVVEGKIISLNPNAIKYSSSKNELDPRVLAKRGPESSCQNFHDTGRSPRTLLIEMGLRGSIDAHG